MGVVSRRQNQYEVLTLWTAVRLRHGFAIYYQKKKNVPTARCLEFHIPLPLPLPAGPRRACSFPATIIMSARLNIATLNAVVSAI